jgi:two-component system alkaline phosphatase synthesis response regulator PhoP
MTAGGLRALVPSDDAAPARRTSRRACARRPPGDRSPPGLGDSPPVVAAASCAQPNSAKNHRRRPVGTRAALKRGRSRAERHHVTISMDLERAQHRDGIRHGETDASSHGRDAAERLGADRRILIAEDDHSCRLALHQYFERSGYRVTEAADGPASLRAVFQSSADLVILDLGLPGVDGLEVLAKIRRDSAVPVIVCSGRDSESERIRSLDLGADDFVVKPFSFAELEARVRAVLRRGAKTPPNRILHYGNLVIDRDTRSVKLAETVVPMTRKEFDLLAFLAASPGRVFSRQDLLERVWASTNEWQGCSTVTEHVRRIRLKIEDDPNTPRWIATARGIGYRFCAP